MANGVSLRRNAAALFVLRSLSYSAPSTPNRTVWPAGPPPRSSWSPGSDFLCHLGLLAVLGYPHQDQLQWPRLPAAPPAKPTNAPARPNAISSAARQLAPR